MNKVTVTTSLSAQPTLNILADSELMQNHQAALPVAPEQELAAVYDSKGLPIILSFSPDGDFYAVVNSPGSPTGWQQINLSASLASFGTAMSFDVGQLPGGNILVAVAIQDAGDATTQNLFVAGPLSNDSGVTDWTKLVWTKSPNITKGTVIDRIFVGPDDDGQGFGIPVIAVSIRTTVAGAISEFIVRAAVDTQSGQVAWNWTDFPTPTALAKILDYSLGSISDLGAGVYILYEGTGSQNFLIFKTFTNNLGRSFDRQFNLPAGAAALQTTPALNGTTALFVAGSGGVQWFSPTNQALHATAQVIASAGDVPDVIAGGLIVRDDQTQNGTTAVWALSGTNLYYLHSMPGGLWSTPVLFRTKVTRIAALRNLENFANELIYIGTDLDTNPNIYYMWQDPVTTLWKQDHIPIHADNKILSLNTYTTRLSFTDPKGSPVSNLSFNFTADSWFRVVINGSTQILDPHVPVSIQPGFDGTITLINSVNDLSVPIVHLTASFFSGTLDVDPAHKVFDGLSKVKSDSDIPVLPETLPPGVNPGDASKAINGMMQLHPSSGAHQADAIVFRPASAPAPPKLNPAAIANRHTFAVSFANSGFQFHDSAAVAAHPAMAVSMASVGSTFSDLGGDILEFLKNVATEVSHFIVTVVNETVTFIVNVAGKVIQFVVAAFEAVYKAISWLFEQIKIGFEKLIDWLGVLFNFDDIITTHKVMVNLTNQAIVWFQGQLPGAETAIGNFFDDLEAKIRALEPIGGSHGSKSLQSGNADDAQSGLPPVVQSGVQSGSQGASGNYAGYHLQHSGVTDADLSPVGAIVGTFESFVDDVLVPTLQSVQATATQLLTDIKDAYTGPGLTVDQLIGKIAGDVLIGILDALKTVAVGIVKFVGDMISLAQSAINAEVDIPFVSALYEKYVGTKLTFLDGLMLLLAIPATVVCKLIAGKAPFADGTHGLDTMSFQDFLKAIEPPAPAAAHSLATAHLESTSAPKPAPVVSNQAGDIAKSYCFWGGIFSAMSGFVYDLLNVWGAVITLPELPTPGPELTKKLTNIAIVQIIVAVATAASSVPVALGPEYGWQWAAWSVGLGDIVKSIALLKLSDTGQQMAGLGELLECFVLLALSIITFKIQCGDDQNLQLDTDGVGFGANLANSLTTGATGLTRIFTEKTTQLVLAGITIALSAVGGVLGIAEAGMDYANGQAS